MDYETSTSSLEARVPPIRLTLAGAVQLPDAIDRIRPSIVQIGATGTEVALGTGFIVTSALHVVTAKHVVDSAADQRPHVNFGGPTIDTPEIKMRGSFLGAEAVVIDVMPDHDLALLEVPTAAKVIPGSLFAGQPMPTPVPVSLGTGGIQEGTSLAVSGYPLNAPSLVTNAGVLASSFSLIEQEGQLQEGHLGDFTANPGNSGGPVYKTADARVIGVCVAGKLTPIVGGEGAHAAGLTVIVPVAAVVELLERNGLVATEVPSKPAARPVTRRTHRKKKRR